MAVSRVNKLNNGKWLYSSARSRLFLSLRLVVKSFSDIIFSLKKIIHSAK